ncbi:acyl-CoA dehydrogenase family protein [Candidatus Poriferisodalis sp.]|uniref:acyl-CoA dehydrogenase family protein n=1 Tax=Candidatus Poriferisodalis sp. TaxID=3101277 RepID=UPI003B01350F
MNSYENRFPADREANRAYLLAAVSGVADALAAGREESEQLRRLSPTSIEALGESGLFLLKTPREVGGAEAHPVVQMDVIEAVAMIDSAASWCMFISAAVTGATLAQLPDEAVDEVVADGFPFMAGALRPGGMARRVDGGYRVSGRWAWGSGVEHSDWVMVPVFCDGPPLIRALVPTSEVILHDNWHTLGMRGTGSGDYELDDVFVPDRFATDLLAAEQLRGGTLHRLGLPAYVVNEHGSFAYALGRLALQTVRDAAIEKKRGYLGGTSIADRQVFQRAIGQGTIRMNACAAGMAEVLERMFDSAAAGPPDPALVTEAQAAAVWCTDEATEVVSGLFRYAGGSAVMLANHMQRILRDIYTVQSHLMVSDVGYESFGRVVLGMDPGGGLP